MSPPRFPSAVPDRVRVVLATRTLLSFISTWRAAALVLVELGAVAFFASGVAEARSRRLAHQRSSEAGKSVLTRDVELAGRGTSTPATGRRRTNASCQNASSSGVRSRAGRHSSPRVIRLRSRAVVGDQTPVAFVDGLPVRANAIHTS